MREISARLSSKSQVTVPADVRRELGIGPHDTLSFVIDDGVVTVRPAAYTLESAFGSVPPLAHDSDLDFKRIAEEAWEDQIEAKSMRGPIR